MGRDPKSAGLLRGLRASIAATVVFAFGLFVLDEPNFAISAAFSALSALIFADYGGGHRARTWAYFHLAWVGALILALGLLVANTVWLAIVLTLVVVAIIRFVGNLGPQLHASVSPLILGFVLGVLVPGPLSAISGRVAGWVAGVIVAAIVAALISPGRSSDRMDRTAGAAACSLARLLRWLMDPDGDPEAVRALHAGVHRDLAELRTMALRPAGPRAHTVARREIVDRLLRLSAIIGPSLGETLGPVAPSLRDLAEADADLLEAAGTVLTDRGSFEPFDACRQRLDRARTESFADLTRQIREGRDPTAIVDEVDGGFVVRAASVHADALAANLEVLRGEPRATEPDRVDTTEQADVPDPSVVGSIRRARALVAGHAGIGSVWTRDAIRAGVALALAVAIGDAFVSQHAFWVALGTLSVLRSNALTTGQTAIGASVGTAVGFALSSAVFAIVGLDTGLLWPILVVAIVGIGALPSVAGFAAGQAAFSVTVIVLFNIVEPLGWRTGLVRLENVALGAAVSAVVALVFWPRKVESLVRQLTTAFSVAAGDYLVRVVRHRSQPWDAAAPDSQAEVITAEVRARAAIGELSEQYRNAPALVATWVQRVGVAAHARSIAQAIEVLGHRFPDGAHATRLDPALGSASRSLAEDLAIGQGSPARPGAVRLDRDLRSHAMTAITEDHDHPDAVASSLFTRDWLLTLAAMIDDRP